MCSCMLACRSLVSLHRLCLLAPPKAHLTPPTLSPTPTPTDSDRAKVKTEGGKIIRVEAHPIPEHPRPRRVKGRVGLVGDAAGYVTKCSGEGIYFAAKSGRMAAEAIVEASEGGKKMAGEGALRSYLDK
jgi:flavin-dependent dehydrogenase